MITHNPAAGVAFTRNDQGSRSQTWEDFDKIGQELDLFGLLSA